MRLLIPALIITASLSAQQPAAQTQTLRDVTALIEEYNDNIRSLTPRLMKATTDAEKTAIRAEARRPEHYAPRLLKIAEEHPGDPGAVKAICWLATQAGGVPEAARATELLGTTYAGSAGVWEAAQQMYRMPRAQAEPVLRAIIKANKNPEDQCAATHALGTLLFNDSENVQTPAGKATREEASALFQQVVTQFTSVTIQGFKPADQAAALLFEMENLSIGKIAPEIEGKDADGAPLRLGQLHGGNVTLLVFWGAWCHSCHGFLPQLRELHARMNGKPFTIVGVNSDPLPDLKTFLAKEQVPWKNFADESSTGAISAVWNIRNWPTLYLLDTKGFIVAKNPALGNIDAIIAPLMK